MDDLELNNMMDDSELGGIFVLNRRGNNVIVCGRPDVMRYFVGLEERAEARRETGLLRLQNWRSDSPERIKEIKK
jgi:hypothetical protein